MPGLSRRARLLLGDFERGSVAYDTLVLLMLLLLFCLPPAWLLDPMVVPR